MATIEEAKNLRNKIDVKGKIVRLDETRSVNKKDGSSVAVRNGVLIDDSGEIKLTLWGDDCGKFAVNDLVELKNGFSNSFKGEVALSRGKYGTLEKAA